MYPPMYPPLMYGQTGQSGQSKKKMILMIVLVLGIAAGAWYYITNYKNVNELIKEVGHVLTTEAVTTITTKMTATTFEKYVNDTGLVTIWAPNTLKPSITQMFLTTPLLDKDTIKIDMQDAYKKDYVLSGTFPTFVYVLADEVIA